MTCSAQGQAAGIDGQYTHRKRRNVGGQSLLRRQGQGEKVRKFWLSVPESPSTTWCLMAT